MRKIYFQNMFDELATYVKEDKMAGYWRILTLILYLNTEYGVKLIHSLWDRNLKVQKR